MGVCFMKKFDLKPSKLPKQPFENCGKQTYFAVVALYKYNYKYNI